MCTQRIQGGAARGGRRGRDERPSSSTAGPELLNSSMDRPWGIRSATFPEPDGHISENDPKQSVASGPRATTPTTSERRHLNVHQGTIRPRAARASAKIVASSSMSLSADARHLDVAGAAVRRRGRVQDKLHQRCTVDRRPGHPSRRVVPRVEVAREEAATSGTSWRVARRAGFRAECSPFSDVPTEAIAVERRGSIFQELSDEATGPTASRYYCPTMSTHFPPGTAMKSAQDRRRVDDVAPRTGGSIRTIAHATSSQRSRRS